MIIHGSGLTARDFPDMWVHIDAAWAGVALCCPEFRPQLQLDAVNAFVDSFCTNFHKVTTSHIRMAPTLTRFEVGSGKL